MRTIKRYPEASMKITYYQNIITSLQADKTNIENALSDINSDLAVYSTGTENTNLEGAYYDYYVDKKNIWLTECNDLIGKYDIFLTQLMQCITRAETLKSEWEYKNTLYDYIWE